MLEYAILGTVQGLVEWLPLSSQGMTTLAASYMGIANPLQLALWMHLGTLLAVLVYFRKEIALLAASRDKRLLHFLLVATCASLPIGLALYLMLKQFDFGSPVLYLVVGAGLILTGFAVHKKKGGLRAVKDASTGDALLAGVLQGFSVVPGISRSGVTIFSLLFRRFSPKAAMTMSYLMSVPVVLAADVFLVFDGFAVTAGSVLALVPAFLVGLLSISVLMRLSERVDFSWFAWGFGVLSLLAFLVA